MTTGRFRQRPTCSLGARVHGEWRIKWYEITVDGSAVSDAVIAAAHAAVDVVCTVSPLPDSDVGFAIVHRGQQACWLLLGRWDGDILLHQTWSADLSSPDGFTDVAAGGPTACVWELAVHAHERDAFIRHVLNPADGARLDSYLADTVTIGPQAAVDRRVVIRRFEAAWHAADIDSLMDLMADEPIYRASTGDGPGSTYRGRAAVRRGFESVIAAEHSGGNGQHGDEGEVRLDISERHASSTWTYSETTADGRVSTVHGVDLWTFDGDKIAVKDAYRKAFPAT